MNTQILSPRRGQTGKVFYAPHYHEGSVVDVEMDDGLSMFSKSSLEDLTRKYGEIILLPLEEAAQRQKMRFISKPILITQAKYHEMLEVLPPIKFRGGHDCESFMLQEFTYADITAIYCRIGASYFQLKDTCALTHDEIVQKCMEANLEINIMFEFDGQIISLADLLVHNIEDEALCEWAVEAPVGGWFDGCVRIA